MSERLDIDVGYRDPCDRPDPVSEPVDYVPEDDRDLRCPGHERARGSGTFGLVYCEHPDECPAAMTDGPDG